MPSSPDLRKPASKEPNRTQFYFDQCLAASQIDDPQKKLHLAALETFTAVLINDGVFTRAGILEKITAPAQEREPGRSEIWMVFKNQSWWAQPSIVPMRNRWIELRSAVEKQEAKIFEKCLTSSEFDDYKRENPDMDWVEFYPNPELPTPAH